MERSIIPKWAEKSGNFFRVNNRICKKYNWTVENNEADRKPAVKECSLFWIPGKTSSSDCVSPYSDGIAEDCWRLRRRNFKTHQWKKSEDNYAFQPVIAILLSPERIWKLSNFSILMAPLRSWFRTEEILPELCNNVEVQKELVLIFQNTKTIVWSAKDSKANEKLNAIDNETMTAV